MHETRLVAEGRKTQALRQVEDQYIARAPLFEGRFSSREDLRALPWVLTKDDLRRLYPFGLCMCPREDLFEYHESFGTTGRPTAGFLSKRDFQRVVEELELSPAGFMKGDMVLIRFPYAISLPAHIFQACAQKNQATVIPCSSRSTVSPYPRVIRMLEELQVSMLCCMPTEAILLAHFALHSGLDPLRDFPHLQGICVAGEDLPPSMRRYIQNLWGVHVHDFYGSTEAGNVAWACEEGRLHLADGYFHADLADPVLPPGTTLHPELAGLQELILTTLEKEALPLLKYRTEDLVLPFNTPCTCGRPGQTFRLLGRLADLFTSGGTILHAGQVKEAVFSLLTTPGHSPFWRAGMESADTQGAGKALVITMERAANPQADSQHLSRLLDIPCRVEAAGEGSIQSLTALEKVEAVGKPRYWLG